jgi:hypothetical protein
MGGADHTPSAGLALAGPVLPQLLHAAGGAGQGLRAAADGGGVCTHPSPNWALLSVGRGVVVSWAGRCCQLGGALLSVELMPFTVIIIITRIAGARRRGDCGGFLQRGGGHAAGRARDGADGVAGGRAGSGARVDGGVQDGPVDRVSPHARRTSRHHMSRIQSRPARWHAQPTKGEREAETW